jgi:protein-S-isoprenylcysteine O-methyltransferase Ste14
MPLGWTLAPTYFLIACWFAFASIFLLRKKPPSVTEVRRDRSAFIPIAVQGISFGIVWGVRRHHGAALFTAALAPYLDVLASVLAVSSVGFVLISVRTLGKQWTVAARLVEGHNLVTQGPYQVVRNPIYTGMFGMLVATGIILARWPAVLIAIAIFLAATMWRIRVEERLLRSQFGAEFEQYCKQVPNALLPGL